MDTASCKYRAFISYSHRDKAWADWLHKGLEHYKIPKSLIGCETPRGEPVPTRIFPVFRDREELPTAVDLGEIIHHALAQSRYLIVICSPASARSQWVNQEIIQFKRLGGESRVLAIIVEGEPNAGSGKPGFAADQECFPEALRYKLGADGALSAEPTEPIAADARLHADGKANALLKLVAGVLGVNYDDLKRRDEVQRKQRQRVAMTTVSVIALIISGLAIAAWVQRNEAVGQKKLADASAREAVRQRDEAIAQRRNAEYNLAQAELGQARQALADGDAAGAVRYSVSAIDGAESAGRELEAAWQVLRRSLDNRSNDLGWQAHRESITSAFFDDAGKRLLTSCKALGEVTVWSAQSGTPLARMKCDGVELAAWIGGKDEVVTLRGTGSDSELIWWDPATGTQLRHQAVPGTLGGGPREIGSGNPEWISLIRFQGNNLAECLIRLDDGFSDFAIPGKQGVRGGTELIPAAMVALSAKADDGVRVFSLRNGREQCRLAGIGPTEKIGLSSLIPSADGANLAAVILSDVRPVAVGVWRLSDGARLVESPVGDWKDKGFSLFAASGNRVVGAPAGLLGDVAAALGRTAVHFPSDDRLLAWSDGTPDSGPAAASIRDFFGHIVGPKMTLRYPELGLVLELANTDDEVVQVTYSPAARRLALGNKAGQIKILRLDRVPMAREVGMPESVNLMATAAGSDQVLLRTGENEMMTWNLATRRVVATMKGVAAGELRSSISSPSMLPLWNAREEWVAVLPSKPGEDSPGADATFHDTTTGALLGHYRVRDPYAKIILAPKGRRALASLPDRKWELLAVEAGKLDVIPLQAAPMGGHQWSIAAAFSPDGEKLYISPGPGWLQEFSTSTGRAQPPFKFGDDKGWDDVTKITVHPAGSFAFVSTMANTWKVDLVTKAVLPLDRSPSGDFFNKGELFVYQEGSRTHWARWPEMTHLGDIDGSYEPALSGLLGNTGALALCKAGMVQEVVVVDIDGGKIRQKLDTVIGADYTLGLAAVMAGDGVRVIRLHDGEILAEAANLRATHVCFAADGSRVGLVLLDSQRFVSLPLTLNRIKLREEARDFIR